MRKDDLCISVLDLEIKISVSNLLGGGNTDRIVGKGVGEEKAINKNALLIKSLLRSAGAGSSWRVLEDSIMYEPQSYPNQEAKEQLFPSVIDSWLLPEAANSQHFQSAIPMGRSCLEVRENTQAREADAKKWK